MTANDVQKAANAAQILLGGLILVLQIAGLLSRNKAQPHVRPEAS